MTKVQDRTVKIGAYEFDEANHVHKLDGKPLTGVTTILGVIAKPMLIQWSANMAVEYIEKNSGKREKDEYDDEYYRVYPNILAEAKVAHRRKKESAGEFGTNVHNAIEQWIKTKAVWVSQNEMEQKAFNHFVKWAEDNKVKFYESEVHVHSRKLWVGGICDIVCEIDGKRYVADIKTSSGIYPEAFIQCSAYAKFLEEMAGVDKMFDGVLILNCNKKGGFEHQFNYDIEGNWECFKAAVTLYRQLNSIK